MTSQPDKFFRDKLENFQKPAPVAAWNRIEAGLEQTNNKGLWMKIAAGLVLLAVATILLWPSSDTTHSNQLSNSTLTQPQPEVKTKTSASENSSDAIESIPSLSVKKNYEKQKKNYSVEKLQEVKKEQLVVIVQSTEEQNQEFEIQNQESTVTTEVIIVQTEVAEELTSKTIVYSINEVNEKFLKKELPVEATLDAKKPSGIQKLMGLAYNLKNSESGLGDLRQKKDEILALNFRDKKEVQNEAN